MKLNLQISIKKLNDIKGATNIKINADIVEFLYKGNLKELVSILNKIPIDNLWIEEPSLEEVFMHYYEKEDKQMPLFIKELKTAFQQIYYRQMLSPYFSKNTTETITPN